MNAEAMNTEGQWCGLCNGYGDHDTAHHASAGKGEPFAPGDSVIHPPCEDPECPLLARLHGERGRVDALRPGGAQVSFPNKGMTASVTLPASKLKLWKPTS
jgi:hypothetical protein